MTLLVVVFASMSTIKSEEFLQSELVQQSGVLCIICAAPHIVPQSCQKGAVPVVMLASSF